jgi:hypothetical protein
MTHIEIERDKLERTMMLLAVATFHTPSLQAQRTELVEAGLKALTAPVQEPVAWMHWLNGPCRVWMNKDEAMMELDRLNREYPVDKNARKVRPLVFGDTTPPAAQPTTEESSAVKPAAPVQEPVAWTVSGKITDWSKDFSAYQTKHYTRPVYTPPAAQRQWVGLTDEEIEPYYAANKPLIKWVEAKLKEKNNG